MVVNTLRRFLESCILSWNCTRFSLWFVNLFKPVLPSKFGLQIKQLIRQEPFFSQFQKQLELSVYIFYVAWQFLRHEIHIKRRLYRTIIHPKIVVSAAVYHFIQIWVSYESKYVNEESINFRNCWLTLRKWQTKRFHSELISPSKHECLPSIT
jgi:hypothetical protein